MESSDPSRNWLDDFEYRASDALRGAGAPAAQRAIAEFEAWWHRQNPESLEEDPSSFESLEINKELELSRTEIRALSQELAALRADPNIRKLEDLKRLEDERRDLLEKLSRLEKENAELADYRAAVQSQVVEMRLKMSRAQEGYEGHIQRLEERVRSLEEQLRVVEENRDFLSSRLEASEAQAKLAQDAKTRSDREVLELQVRLDSLRKNLSGREADLANREGTLAELRQQAASLQERLIRSENALSAGQRREISEIARRSENVESRLAAQGRQADERVAEATHFLELKLREIQERNEEQFEEFRDLFEALSRFRLKRRG